MAKLDKHVLNEFAKTVTAEQQKDDGIIVYGIVISITDDGAIVRLDGKTDNTLTPCATAVSVTEGDRVSVNVGRHQAIIIGNAEPSPDPNGESKLVGGALAANKVITDYLNADYIKADVIAANYVTSNYLETNYLKTGNLEAQYASIAELIADYIKTTELTAEVAKLGYLKADSATITDLQADTAKIHNLTAEQLSAATGYVGTLTAGNVTANDIISDTAKVHNLTANELSSATGYIGSLVSNNIAVSDISAATGYVGALSAGNVTAHDIISDTAKVHNLTADQLSATTGYVGALTAGNVTANDIISDTAKVHNLTADQLSAATGYIGTLTSNNVTANDIVSGHATIGSLDSNYAQIDLANVSNAWIQNGVVKDAAISDAQIIGVSANKLTAGTIDASNITVTNLNATNITTGTLNGQRIGTGSLSLDKLAEDVYTEDEVDNMLSTMQSEIDGAIETFTGSVVPTLNNYPANAWSDNDTKSKHVGDVYYVVNAGQQADGYCYRFAYDNTTGTYGWVLIKDSDVTAALQRLIDAEGDIDDLETFQSTTASWITNTDEELSSLKTRTSSVETSLGNKVETSVFNTLSQTVDANSSNITSLSSRVDTKADGSTVTALSNTVNSVQQTATSNSSKISNLTTVLGTNADGTTSANDIVHKVSEIDQDLDSITTRVGRTETWQNNFQVGGRNLIRNSATQRTATSASGSAYVSPAPRLTDYGQILLINAGDIFTYSFDYVVTGNSATGAYIYTQAKGSQTNPSGSVNANNYPSGKFINTFALTETQASITDITTMNIRLRNATDGAVITVSNIKLEKGNVATDWSPAPEDIEVRVTEAESSITQNAEAIALRATKTEVTNNITNAINGIEIGGRNLWKNTSTPVTLSPRTAGTAGDHYNYATIYFANSLNIKENEAYTISGHVAFTSADTSSYPLPSQFSAYLSYQPTISFTNISVDANGNFAHVVYAEADGNNATQSLLYAGLAGSTRGLGATFSNLKIEKGNKATDWSPAPEDLEAYADSAVSTAKAEIKVTTDGISSEVSKVSSAKYVTSSTSSWSLTNIKTYAAEGHVENWNVNSTANLRVGDTVYVTGTDSTRNCKIYIKTTVTAVNSGTNFTGTSHGYEDVLPVETIKSTINQSADSVQIEARHVDIAGAAIFTSGRLSQTSLNNAYDAKGAASAVQTNLDNLAVGGRNLASRSQVFATGTSYHENNYIYNFTAGSGAGLYFKDTLFTIGTKYVLSFKIAKVSGTFTYIGGHHSGFTCTAFYVDGIKSSKLYNDGQSITDNTSTHTVEVHFIYNGNASDNKLYIQPDRGGYISGNTSEFNLWDLKLEVGDKATGWSPAPEDATAEEQYIYKQAVSGTANMGGTTTWVTVTSESITTGTPPNSATGLTPIWTTKRPSYQKNYPILFVAKQKKTVGGTVTCTTPVKDDTTTIIDGGHIITGTIDANSINASSGTFNTANIPNLDAGKITSGYISADRIQSGTIVISALSNDAQSKVLNSNISIGGRNLIKGTDPSTVIERAFPSSSSSSYCEGYTPIIARVDGISEYVASFDAKASVDNLEVICYWYNPNTTTHGESSTGQTSYNANGADGNTKVTLTTSWKRYWIKWTQSDTASTNKNLILCRQMTKPSSGTNTVYIRAPKMEVGNSPTAWSPAPEDVYAREHIIYYRTNSTSAPAASSTWVAQNDTVNSQWTTKKMSYDSTYKYLYTCLQSQKSTGEIVNSDVKRDETITIIDGGNIITESITADKINATSINASKVLTVGALSDSAQSSVLNSNIDIGGRNLLKKSNEYRSNGDYQINNYSFGDNPPKHGETVTMQIKGQLADTKTRWGIYNSGGYVNPLNILKTDYDANTGIYTKTGTWLTSSGSYTAINTYVSIYTIANSQSGTSTIEWVKLERGNIATDWSPAPEDLPADLASATGTTVINGAHITTGTIDANRINASSGTFNTANIPNLDAAKITSGYISADRIQAGTLAVNKINASSGTFNTANIPNLSAAKITTGIIKDSVNKNSWNLDTGALTITNGSINITTSSDSNDYIKLNGPNSNIYTSMSSRSLSVWTNNSTYTSNAPAQVYTGGFSDGSTYHFGVDMHEGAYNSGTYTYRTMLYPGYIRAEGNNGSSSVNISSGNVSASQYISAGSDVSAGGDILADGDVYATSYHDRSGNTITDYVIAQSIQSTYGYTKWASGKLECWRRETKTVNIDTKWNYTYYNSTAISLSNYPLAFVGSNPMVIKTVETSNASCWALPLTAGESLTNPGQITVLRDGSTSSNVSVTVMVYAVGRWK